MNKQDEQLAKKASKGNKKAMAQLLKNHYDQIYRTAYLYVHNKEDALDTVQEAAFQALQSIHTLKNPEFFMTWFTKILIRCAGRLLEKKKNLIPISESILSSMLPGIEDKHPHADYLLEAIFQLNERYRTAIILFYYHDYSISTISQMIDLPEGTVKTHLSRGKNQLRIYLEEEWENG